MLFCDAKKDHSYQHGQREYWNDQCIKFSIVIVVVFMRVFENKKEKQEEATKETNNQCFYEFRKS